MNELNHLDFPFIISRLSERARTAPGLRLIQALSPAISPQQQASDFALIRELTEFLKFDGRFQFDDVPDISDALSRSAIEGYFLDTEFFLNLKYYLDIWRDCRESFFAFPETAAKYPLLNHWFLDVEYPEDFHNRLKDLFMPDGTVSDNASPELRRLRKRKLNIRGEIHNGLNKVLEKLSVPSQDRLITMRDGRLMIPVKSQLKSRARSEFQSIVHSYSQSGETAFMEPSEVLNLNNEMVELDELEWEEIRRILTALTAETGGRRAVFQTIITACGTLECLVCRARLVTEENYSIPGLTDGPELNLKQARHPVIGPQAVPIDLSLGKTWYGIIISGPNAGGKTVALKTAGLLAMMALSAIPIPADTDSTVGRFDHILAEIGDEQSIENELSSFSGHIRKLAAILEMATCRSLVLIDEITSATEPREGESLGRAYAEALIERQTRFIITTHYQGIKELAWQNAAQVINGSVAFDEENYRPLYTLMLGTSGQSYAFKAARKYGLAQSVITRAESLRMTSETELEKTLKAMEKERQELVKKKNRLESQFNRLRFIKENYDREMKQAALDREKMINNGLKAVKPELEILLEDIRTLRLQVKEKKTVSRDDEQKLSRIMHDARAAEKEVVEKTLTPLRKLETGMTVYVPQYDKKGTIEAMQDKSVKVRLGILSVWVNRDEVFENKAEQEKALQARKTSYTVSSTPFILDVRGQRAEEALTNLDRCLESAGVEGRDLLHIIHGKGEGILSKVIREALKASSWVKSFEFAKPQDGGQGKTIVHLK